MKRLSPSSRWSVYDPAQASARSFKAANGEAASGNFEPRTTSLDSPAVALPSLLC